MAIYRCSKGLDHTDEMRNLLVVGLGLLVGSKSDMDLQTFPRADHHAFCSAFHADLTHGHCAQPAHWIRLNPWLLCHSSSTEQVVSCSEPGLLNTIDDSRLQFSVTA